MRLQHTPKTHLGLNKIILFSSVLKLHPQLQSSASWCNRNTAQRNWSDKVLKNVLHKRITAWEDLLRTLLAGLKKELSNFNNIRVNESKILKKEAEEEKKGQCNRNLVWLQRLKRLKAKGTSCVFYLLVFGLRCTGASLQMSASQKANQKKQLWSEEWKGIHLPRV